MGPVGRWPDGWTPRSVTQSGCSQSVRYSGLRPAVSRSGFHSCNFLVSAKRTAGYEGGNPNSTCARAYCRAVQTAASSIDRSWQSFSMCASYATGRPTGIKPGRLRRIRRAVIRLETAFSRRKASLRIPAFGRYRTADPARGPCCRRRSPIRHLRSAPTPSCPGLRALPWHLRRTCPSHPAP